MTPFSKWLDSSCQLQLAPGLLLSSRPHDICGKRYGAPLWQLLRGPLSSHEVLASHQIRHTLHQNQVPYWKEI